MKRISVWWNSYMEKYRTRYIGISDTLIYIYVFYNVLFKSILLFIAYYILFGLGIKEIIPFVVITFFFTFVSSMIYLYNTTTSRIVRKDRDYDIILVYLTAYNAFCIFCFIYLVITS